MSNMKIVIDVDNDDDVVATMANLPPSKMIKADPGEEADEKLRNDALLKTNPSNRKRTHDQDSVECWQEEEAPTARRSRRFKDQILIKCEDFEEGYIRCPATKLLLHV